jgi:diguanylate cyclase (GGDEF)-like protein/PAS domain S-box-containing protein
VHDDPIVSRGLTSAGSLLRTFLETTPDVVIFKDREGGYLAVSRSFYHLRHGLGSADEALGKTDFDFYPRAFAETTLAAEREVLETGQPMLDVDALLTDSGEREIWMTWSKMPLFDEAGGTVGTFTVARDTTREKLADFALREQTERLSRIVDTQRDVAAADLDLDAVMNLICERTQELTGAPGASIVTLEDDRLVMRRATGFLAGRVGVELPVDGSFIGWLLRNGTGGLATDSHTDPRFSTLARLHGVRSVVSVPLRHAGAMVAHLQVHSPEPHAFGEETLHTLELLSVVLSSALSHAAEFEALTRFQAIFEAAPIGIVRTDAAGRTLEANPALERMLGYTGEELGKLSLEEYTHPDDIPMSGLVLDELITGKRDSGQVEKRFFRKDGETIWAQVTARLVRDAEGAPAYTIAMIEDISKRKKAEEGLLRQAQLNAHQALHDSLTGLANRTVFRDRIAQATRRARRDGQRVAVLMMDLDRFKEVNDSLGHYVGDFLLQELGARLEGVLRDSDTVARLGGDEFGLLLPGRCDPEEIAELLGKIAAAVEQPIVLQNLPLTIEASIGVAFFPDDGEDVDTLLRHADVAMYMAKEDDAGYAFYDPTADTYDPARLTLVGELRRAIEQGELVLHYQPTALLATGETCAVEALLRWSHPERGLIMPDDFIPIAQQTGLMKPLTLHVVDEALRQSRAWLDKGISLPVAVNISTRNLLDLAFPEQVKRLLEKWEVGAELLKFEITESMMLGDPLRSKVVLERLSAIGIRLAIDDFGTGYSSLRHLRRLPFDEIKIDRSFVSNMVADEDDATIVRSTIELARNLGLLVVAEGVESEEIWRRLDALGCTVAQGWYLSPPLPARDLELWLRARERLPVAV